MPRSALLCLVAAMLALHGLLLGLLPWGGQAAAPAPAPRVFNTRLLTPDPPQNPPPVASAAAARPESTATPAPSLPRKAARRPAKVLPPPSPPDPPPDPLPDPLPDPPATGMAPGDWASAAPPAPDAPTTEAAPGLDAGSETGAETGAQAMAESAPALAHEPAAAASQAPSATDTPAAAHPVTDAVAEAAAAPPPASGIEVHRPGSAAPVNGQDVPVRLPPSSALDFAVSGQAKGFTYHARAELHWQHDGAQYQARQQVKAFLIGARTQTSRGQISALGLQPERFGDKTRSERAAHFDYAQQRVTFSANTPAAPLAPGAQDRLSVFIELGALLAAAPERYPNGTLISLTTVSATSSARWTFSVEGAQLLELPLGPTPALKLQRLPPPDKPYEQKAELWLGSSLGYLPVRIRITQSNGDWVDLQLDGLTPL